jgi:hypothetical protein
MLLLASLYAHSEREYISTTCFMQSLYLPDLRRDIFSAVTSQLAGAGYRSSLIYIADAA